MSIKWFSVYINTNVYLNVSSQCIGFPFISMHAAFSQAFSEQHFSIYRWKVPAGNTPCWCIVWNAAVICERPWGIVMSTSIRERGQTCEIIMRLCAMHPPLLLNLIDQSNARCIHPSNLSEDAALPSSLCKRYSRHCTLILMGPSVASDRGK